METNKIRAVIKEPYKKAQVVEIEPKLKTFQSIVDGHIECFYLPNSDGSAVGYCNEEGLLMGLDPNIYRPEYKDAVVGTVVFVNTNENGEDISLTDEQIKDITDYIEKNSVKDFSEFYFHINTRFKFYENTKEEMEM